MPWSAPVCWNFQHTTICAECPLRPCRGYQTIQTYHAEPRKTMPNHSKPCKTMQNLSVNLAKRCKNTIHHKISSARISCGLATLEKHEQGLRVIVFLCPYQIKHDQTWSNYIKLIQTTTIYNPVGTKLLSVFAGRCWTLGMDQKTYQGPGCAGRHAI